MSSCAYRFLGRGAVAELTGVAWKSPVAGAPAEWMTAPADGTSSGVYAYRARDLPHWIGPELWEVETAGRTSALSTRLVVEQVRLVAQVKAWDEARARDFAEACIERLRERVARLLAHAGHLSVGRALADASLAEAAAVLQPISGAAHGEPCALAARYLEDAIGCLGAGLFGCVAYIAHVASVDERLGLPPDEASERDLQAGWLAERLGLTG